jgi:hypothetical protein
MGSGDNGELTFLDIIGLLSFFIALENLGMNLTQKDKQELMQGLDEKTNTLLAEVHNHLKIQDQKLDEILKRLEEK